MSHLRRLLDASGGDIFTKRIGGSVLFAPEGRYWGAKRGMG
jgi:hypothetical protein